MMVRPIVHLALHALVPGVVARLAWRERWLRVWLVLLLAMLADVDHLLATPRYDPNRCSIFFHPLHSHIAIAIYVAGLFWRRTRIVAIGLLIHMGLDGIDCLWMRCAPVPPHVVASAGDDAGAKATRRREARVRGARTSNQNPVEPIDGLNPEITVERRSEAQPATVRQGATAGSYWR